MDCGRGRRCGRAFDAHADGTSAACAADGAGLSERRGCCAAGQKPKERGRRAEQPGGVRRSGAQGDDFGDRPSGRRARSAHGERGLHRRGNDVLYRQRIAFDFGKRSAARRTRAAAAAAGARRGAARRRQREGKNQGRLNVSGVRRPPHLVPAARRKLFSKKGLTNPAGFRIIYMLHRWCTK